MLPLKHPPAAVFLDRDGVINYNREDYVKSWEEFEFLPGSLEALRLLAALRVPLLIVTNQSAVGRARLTLAGLETIHQRMLSAIRQAGGRIDAIYLCPHAPAAACRCRKPSPQMLLRAAQDWRIDLARSIFIGDSAGDLLTALAAGVQPLLVHTGFGAALARDPLQHSLLAQCAQAPDLRQAVATLHDR